MSLSVSILTIAITKDGALAMAKNTLEASSLSIISALSLEQRLYPGRWCSCETWFKSLLFGKRSQEHSGSSTKVSFLYEKSYVSLRIRVGTLMLGVIHLKPGLSMKGSVLKFK